MLKTTGQFRLVSFVYDKFQILKTNRIISSKTLEFLDAPCEHEVSFPKN